MTPADQFLSSLDRSWKEFSGAWKKARMDASEKSIHHLRVRTRRLREGARDLRSEFARLHEKAAPEKIQRSVEKTLNQCRNAFLKAYRQFQPADGESLHNMRIALKELRYSLEAAEPVLGRSV